MIRLITAALLLLGVVAFEDQQGSTQWKVPESFNTPRTFSHLSSALADASKLRVVTWNIDHGAHTSEIAADLARLAPDICLLQEVDLNTRRTGYRDIAEDLAQRLQFDGSYGVEFEELSQGRETPAFVGQATLTRLPITRARVLRFHLQSTFWTPRAWIPSLLPLMQRRLGNRIALVTEVTWRSRPLVIYNLHLESRSAGTLQHEQLEEVLSDMQRYPAGTFFLLGGDLNSKYFPTNYLRQLQSRGFQSALGQRVERSHKIIFALDWLYAKAPLRWDEGDVRKEMKASDHYPVAGILTSR
jgi:endonuclease/exonuclease/phosphatase family metal-dependent hydrolase